MKKTYRTINQTEERITDMNVIFTLSIPSSSIRTYNFLLFTVNIGIAQVLDRVIYLRNCVLLSIIILIIRDSTKEYCCIITWMHSLQNYTSLDWKGSFLNKYNTFTGMEVSKEERKDMLNDSLNVYCVFYICIFIIIVKGEREKRSI